MVALYCCIVQYELTTVKGHGVLSQTQGLTRHPRIADARMEGETTHTIIATLLVNTPHEVGHRRFARAVASSPVHGEVDPQGGRVDDRPRSAAARGGKPDEGLEKIQRAQDVNVEHFPEVGHGERERGTGSQHGSIEHQDVDVSDLCHELVDCFEIGDGDGMCMHDRVWKRALHAGLCRCHRLLRAAHNVDGAGTGLSKGFRGL